MNIKNLILLILGPLKNLIYNTIFGKSRKVDHIWRPLNYQKKRPIFWHFVQLPLEERGIYLPLNFKYLHDLKSYKTFNDEHLVLEKFLEKTNTNFVTDFFIDIGSGDGVDMSNTFNLVRKNYKGAMFEFDDSKFAKMATIYRDYSNIDLFKIKITPANVASLVEACSPPNVIKVLNLDLDSYDYFVLEELLNNFTFQFLILEINSLIPVEVDFTVTYDENFMPKNDYFQGASFSMFYKLLNKNNYSIVYIEKNFVLAINDGYLSENIEVLPIEKLINLLNNSIINSNDKEYLKTYNELTSVSSEEAIQKIKNLFKSYSNFQIDKSGL